MHDGNVKNDSEQKKVGTHEITLTSDGERDPLFQGFPKTFGAQYWHRDSATELPSGAVILANGCACRFSALRYGERAYTFQFHPEVNHSDFAARLKEYGHLPEGVEPKSIVRKTPEASTIISSWIERILSAVYA